jgi:hypothetical protein
VESSQSDSNQTQLQFARDQINELTRANTAMQYVALTFFFGSGILIVFRARLENLE